MKNSLIGQETLTSKIDRECKAGKFPRFSLLVGQTGSGRHLIVDRVAWALGAVPYVLPDVKVDTIREMISDAYKVTTPTLYVIYNGDTMSLPAKNALLKVTEEPPHNAYFIMTLTSLENTLDTIKSRAGSYYMDMYFPTEILKYADSKYALLKEEREIVQNVCSVPGDVDLLVSYGVQEFYDYVELVVDNIGTVSGSNSFKIADKIQLRDEEDKYSLKLFWKAFQQICLSRIAENPLKYAYGVRTTSEHLHSLRITGINKASLFDMWILNIRKEWFD